MLRSHGPRPLAPGDYVLQMLVADDLTDPLAIGNSRRTGNSTFVDVTVQVPTDIQSMCYHQPLLPVFRSICKGKSLTMMILHER